MSTVRSRIFNNNFFKDIDHFLHGARFVYRASKVEQPSHSILHAAFLFLYH